MGYENRKIKPESVGTAKIPLKKNCQRFHFCSVVLSTLAKAAVATNLAVFVAHMAVCLSNAADECLRFWEEQLA
jgi:hypothetical protein